MLALEKTFAVRIVALAAFVVDVEFVGAVVAVVA